jgi:hypothetical protein
MMGLIVGGIFFILILYLSSKKIHKRACPYPKAVGTRPHTLIDVFDIVPRDPPKIGSPTQIPKVIHQTNQSTKIPIGMAEASKSIINANPDYEYKYYSDADSRAILENAVQNKKLTEKTLEAYDKLIPGAYKADLFRYCILYLEGGVYIDTGMISVQGLTSFIRPGDKFVSPEDNNTGGIYNAFIACVPNHPIIVTALSMAVTNVLNGNYTNSCLAITGPLLLSDAFDRIIGPVEVNKDYGNGIRLIKYTRDLACESGEIFDGNKKVMNTRHPTYRLESSWYNTNPHYSEMWRAKKVYR